MSTQLLLCDTPVLCPIGTPRPKESDPEVMDIVLGRVFEQVVEWLGADYRPAEDEEIKSQLREAIKHGWDGYGIARDLENYSHWNCDSELVETLENVSWWRCDAQRTLEARWVTATGATPKLKVGDLVEVMDRGEHYQGIIAAVDHKQGKYTVRIPALGHVTEEVAREKCGTTGILLPWEVAEAPQRR